MGSSRDESPSSELARERVISVLSVLIGLGTPGLLVVQEVLAWGSRDLTPEPANVMALSHG